MNEGLVVLSLFDGMSCGQLALQRAGIKVKQYYAAEIDNHAIQVTQKNFPDTIQLGDAMKVFGKNLPKIDLIIGGSPCQGFSFAGKGLNFEDPRSKLFFEFVRLVKECNPKCFLLENVKMKKEHELVISQYMKTNPVEINSALVSAQNRVRLYWTNINQKPYGLFGDMMADIPQPKDKGIILRDILESEVPDKYYISAKALERAFRKEYSQPRINPDKTGTLGTKNNSGQLGMDSWTTFICGILNQDWILKYTEKSTCIDANYHKGVDNHSQRTMVQINQSTESNGNQPYQQNRVYDVEGICPYLNTDARPHAILIPEATKKGFAEILPGECFDFENPNSETRRGRKMDDKSNCLMAKETDFMHYTKDAKIRRLTPTECERLQTVPDGYTGSVSDTQRYRMLGNGWTIDVIAHILSFIKPVSAS